MNPVWIAFTIGLLLGGFGGIVLMCIFSITDRRWKE